MRRAVEALKGVDKMKHQLGLTATLVAAYERQGNIDAAVEVLDQAIAHWQGSKEEGSTENVLTLTEECGKLLLKHKQWEKAAERFKQLQRLGKKTPQVNARLTMCLAHVDVNAAEQLCEDLDCEAADISPEVAEEVLAIKARELGAVQEPTAEVPEVHSKKKRRPGKKPANATGEPDPERWRAKRDRASYKALSKRQIRELKREKQDARNKRQRAVASERDALRAKLRAHYEALREEQSK